MHKVMGKGGASALALVGMAVGAASPAEAAPKLGYEFGYFLPRTCFGADGTPTRLKYGSASGGADIASVIDAGGDGFTTLRGGAAAARDRQLQVLRDKKEYRELTTALNGTN